MSGIDITLELEGFDGESKAKSGEIDVTDVTFSSRVPRDLYTGQPHGKREHPGVTFVKPTDTASALLMNALWKNQKINKGTFKFKKAGGEKQEEYLTVTLKEVYVGAFTFKAADQAPSALPSESVHLVYRSIEVAYKEQQAKGTVGGTYSAQDELATAG